MGQYRNWQKRLFRLLTGALLIAPLSGLWLSNMYVQAQTPSSIPSLPDPSALTDPSFARPGYANIATPFLTKTRYLLSLDVNWPTGQIAGQARILFVNNTPDTLKTIVFRLYPNHPATPATGTPLAHVRMKIQSLAINGSTVQGETTDPYQSVLEIPLSAPIAPGGSAQIDASYTVNYAAPIDELDGLEDFPMLAVYQDGDWRRDISTKGLDYAFTETALYAVNLRTPNNVALYNVGSVTSTDTDGSDHVIYHITTGPVRDFIFSLTKGWGYIEGRGAPVPVDVHYKGSVTAAQEEAQIAAQAMTYYDQTFGPYPYAHLTVMVLGYPSGGMQYPTLVMNDNARDTNYRRFITGHEVAHEWFYAILGNDPLRHAWLDESMAQISLYLFFHDVYGADVAEAEWTHILYWSEQAGGSHAVDTAVMQFTDFDDYMSHTYGLGAVFMRKLMEKIGEAQFIAGIKAYYKATFLGIGTPQQFFDAMQAQTTIPLAPIFCKGGGSGFPGLGYCPIGS